MRTPLALALIAAALAGCARSPEASAPVDPATMQEQIQAAQKAESAQPSLPEIKPGDKDAAPE